MDLLTKNGSDAVKLSVRRMCKADLLAVAQLEKECFAEAWSASLPFFVSKSLPAFRSLPDAENLLCKCQPLKIQKKLQDTSVHIWQQMSFLSQMSLYFHHTDGAAQPNQLM